MVTLENVKKKFGNKTILSNVDLGVSSGEVIGIVGTNGSGKSTILRLICGLMYADQGKVIVNGQHIKPAITGKTANDTGILIEAPMFLPQYSGLRNLCILASIQNKINKETIRETLKQVGLNPDDRKKVRNYSQGMKQRLAIAQAIMEKPSVLLFDEPTNGLDKEGVALVGELIQKQAQNGVAVVLVSHQQAEIDMHCDKVYVLEDYTLKQLRNQREQTWIVIFDSLNDLEKMSTKISNLTIIERRNGLPAAKVIGHWQSADELRKWSDECQCKIIEIQEK